MFKVSSMNQEEKKNFYAAYLTIMNSYNDNDSSKMFEMFELLN